MFFHKNITIILILLLVTMIVSSCATSRKSYNLPVLYKIKINQFVFPVDINQKHYCYDIYIEDSVCSIFQINKLYKKSSHLLFDTLYVGSFRLSGDDIKEVDSIVDDIWKKQDTIYSSNTIDGNLTNLYLKKKDKQRKIVIINWKEDIFDRLFEIVNVYCNKATIPLLQRTGKF